MEIRFTWTTRSRSRAARMKPSSSTMAIEIDSEAPDFKKELNKLIHYIMFALLQNRIKNFNLILLTLDWFTTLIIMNNSNPNLENRDYFVFDFCNFHLNFERLFCILIFAISTWTLRLFSLLIFSLRFNRLSRRDGARSSPSVSAS